VPQVSSATHDFRIDNRISNRFVSLGLFSIVL
jgi:hypothetical protein